MISLNQIKKIIIFSIVSLMVFPNFASALSISELQAQIATLLNQVQQLQQQLSQKTGQSCFTFNSDMQIGGSGSSVASLQKVLESEGFDIDNNEINSSSFGESTASAVVGFQERYRSEILNPAGLSRGTGYIGARTRAKLNTIGCGTNPVVPTPTQPTPVVAPKPPFNVIIASAIDIDGSAKLDWNNVDGQKFYVYKNKNDGTFQFLAFTTDKFYKDTSGLSKDVKYGYYVTALNIYGESEPSSKVYVGPITTPTLTILSPQNNTTYSVIPSTVRWNVSAPVSPTATFLVELKAVNVSAYSSGQTIFSTTVTRAQAGCSASDECSYPLTSSLHGTQTITVKNLENNVSNSRTFTVTPTVTTPLTITNPSPLPNAEIGTSYKAMLGVSGGPSNVSTNSYNWSVTSGYIPSGLILGASDFGMIISGTPTAGGTYNFTLRASYGSQSGSKNFTLTVNPADVVITSPLTITNPSPLTNAKVGTSYTAMLGVSGGPSNVSTNSYNWSVTSGYIPSGLILGASDFGMVISGTPTAGGTYNFTLRASYGSQSGSKNLTLTVDLATAEVISYPTASLDARVGSQAYSSLITAKVGETIAYRWSSNADSAYSQYYVDPAYTSTSNCGGIIGGGPFTWVANNLNGSTSATVEACQAGRTYSIKYTAVNSQTRGGLSTDSVLTINVPSVTTALNTSSDLNQMANVLTSASAILKNMLNLLR